MHSAACSPAVLVQSLISCSSLAWQDVSGAKPLSGTLAGNYRLRTGDYRLRFRVEGDIVRVDKIGHRREFYER